MEVHLDGSDRSSDTEIYDATMRCLRGFQDCAESSRDQRRRDVEILQQRLQVWARYSGAISRHGLSLDDRLEALSDVKTATIRLLNMIMIQLDKVLSEQDEKLHEANPEHEAVNTRSTVSLLSKNAMADIKRIGQNSRWETYKGSTWENISAAIDMLLEIAFAIRDESAQSRQFQAPVDYRRPDDAYFDNILRVFTRRQFPHARRSLTDQLARSVYVRRRRILWRQSHEKKLSIQRSAQDDKFFRRQMPTDELSATQNLQIDLGEDEPFPPPPPSSTNLSRPYGSSVIFRKLHAPTIVSGITKGAVIQDSLIFAYPDPPSVLEDQQDIVCPYCDKPLPTSISEGDAWRQHIDQDLLPYVCLSEKCLSPLKFFSSKSQWRNHMTDNHGQDWHRKVHMKTWFCDVNHGNIIEFTDVEKFGDHLTHDHGFNSIRRDVMVQHNHSQAPRISGTCPFCEDKPNATSLGNATIDDPTILHDHIAGHLGNIALLSLPSPDVPTNGDHKADSSDVNRTEPSNIGVIDSSSAGTSRKVEAYSYEQSRHILIPLLRNTHFTGREKELHELEQRLLISKEAQKLAIYGLGGTGKTQLALEFSYTVREKYPDYSIFWVSALSIARFKQDYIKIAKMCSIGAGSGEDDLMQIVQEYLSSEEVGRWLLIVDGADDMKILFDYDGIVKYLPQVKIGVILFTTRYKSVAVDATDGDILNLETMNIEEAMLLFKNLLKRNDLTQDIDMTRELLEKLEYLPLAISQAASYILKLSITVPKYLNLIKSSDEGLVKLLSRDFRKESSNAVATTWLVSFEMIKKEEPIAADILFFLACLENKSIPHSILPATYAKGDLVHAIGTLISYSFLAKQDARSEVYDMHRLVHLAVGIWMQKQDIVDHWNEVTISHLAKIFPSCEWENRILWREYTPHAVRILRNTDQMPTAQRADLCLRLGQCLQEDGRLSEAIQWISQCVSWRNISLPEDHPDRLYAQYTLATTYELNGKLAEAIEMLEEVVSIQTKVLEEEHPDRIAPYHALARAYRSNGHVKEAIEILEKVVSIQTKVLGEEHPDRLTSYRALATTYELNGQLAEAIEMLEEVVSIQTKVLGEEHPARLFSYHALARAYLSNGHVKEAIEILEKVVSIQTKTLGKEHPDPIASSHMLALAYRSNGEVEKAVEILEKVVLIRMRTLGEHHPDRLASEQNLATSYDLIGRVDEAISLMQHVVALRHRLSSDHPYRLKSEAELSRMLERKESVTLLTNEEKT